MSKLYYYGRVIIMFFFSAALMAVCLTSLIQGILIQLQGAVFNALGLYALGWLCLGTSMLFFNKGLRMSKLVSP